MIAATITSGQSMPVPKTPMAANGTAAFPLASLREQIQMARMFASPMRKSIRATQPFAIGTATPTLHMTLARGSVPWKAPHAVLLLAMAELGFTEDLLTYEGKFDGDFEICEGHERGVRVLR